MGNCVVIVQFNLPKRTEEQALMGATSTAPIYRGRAAKGLIRKTTSTAMPAPYGVYLWESCALAEVGSPKIVQSTRRFRVRPSAHLVRYPRHKSAI